MNNPSKLNRQKEIAGKMGVGITLGLIGGVIFGNIAMGLSLGILLGGLGVIWKKIRTQS